MRGFAGTVHGLIAAGCLLAGCSFASLDELQAGSASTGPNDGGGTPLTTVSASTSSSALSSSSGSDGGGGEGGREQGSSGSGGRGGAGGGATTTGGGGEGGRAEPPPDLVDTGLLVRYFMDEAPSGDLPDHLLDVATSPFDLSIDYPDDGGMQYVTEDEHVGLAWDAAGAPGRASETASGKILGLNDAVYATIEVVARVDEAHFHGSRLLHIGTDAESAFSLAVAHDDEVGQIGTPTRLEMRTRTVTKSGVVYRYAFFDADLSVGRAVIHAVYDSQRAEPLERFRVFQDGVELTRQADERPLPELNEDLFIDSAQKLVVGNRDNGQRSIHGAIFYAAIYRAALDAEEIANNVAELQRTDDR